MREPGEDDRKQEPVFLGYYPDGEPVTDVPPAEVKQEVDKDDDARD